MARKKPTLKAVVATYNWYRRRSGLGAHGATGSGNEGLLVDEFGYLILDSNGFPIAI